MRDRRLDKNIVRVENFIEQWKRLSHFLDRGFEGESFTDEEESAFLELKSMIAQEHELLMTTLGSETDRTDRALRLLNIAPSLQSICELEDDANRRLTTEWHTTYLSFQALLGRLKGRRLQLSTLSTMRHGMRSVFANPLVIFLVALAAGYGVYRFAQEAVPKLIELRETKHD